MSTQQKKQKLITLAGIEMDTTFLIIKMSARRGKATNRERLKLAISQVLPRFHKVITMEPHLQIVMALTIIH